MVLFLFWNFGNCSSASKKFFRLKETNLQFSILYILRPSRTPLALWKERILVFKYKDSFQNSNPILEREFFLADGEYICLELEEGYYLLKTEDSEKILYLKKNEIRFMDYYIFNETFFSTSESYFKELNAKEAMEFLLNFNRLDRNSLSTD